jgi:predicted nucleic acid-binding protein
VILYCDTSALVKLFVDEANAGLVRNAVETSAGIATHMIAYAEACSAFARLAERNGDRHLFARFRRTLDEHWGEWQIVAVDEPLVRRAADLAGSHRLRGFDSVHLAAAESVFRARRAAEFRFAVFDSNLIVAATAVGIPVLEA